MTPGLCQYQCAPVHIGKGLNEPDCAGSWLHMCVHVFLCVSVAGVGKPIPVALTDFLSCPTTWICTPPHWLPYRKAPTGALLALLDTGLC